MGFEVKCAGCGDIFTEEELRDLLSFNEPCWLEGDFFLCPDCLDMFQQMGLEEQEDFVIAHRMAVEKADHRYNDRARD